MKCEICKTIEKLGLAPATHEPWVCADSWSARQAFRSAQVSIHHYFHGLGDRLHAKCQHAGQALYRRAQYVTLGL